MQEVNNDLILKWKYKVKWLSMIEKQVKTEVAEKESVGIEY